MEYRYEYLFPDELRERIAAAPAAFVPTGLLEWHGMHLPLGQDALKAHGICVEAAGKLGGGVVLPPNYFGAPGYSTYLGTLTYAEATLELLFLDYLSQLRKLGFKVAVLLTGHYGPTQVNFIKGVAEKSRLLYPDLAVIARPEYEGILIDGEQVSDHAGKWETSMFWYLYPDAVRMERYETVMDDMKAYENTPLDYYKEGPHWDFGCDVRAASSRELGRRAVEAITDKLVSDVTALLNR